MTDAQIDLLEIYRRAGITPEGAESLRAQESATAIAMMQTDCENFDLSADQALAVYDALTME